MLPFIAEGLLSVASKVLDRLIPDPAAKAAAQLELLKMQQTGELANLAADTELARGQLDINLEEARSGNWFAAGWRPMVGWTGAMALAYVAIIEPVGRFIALVGFGYKGAFPIIDTNVTMQVLLGILGLGGMRSFEKSKGVAK